MVENDRFVVPNHWDVSCRVSHTRIKVLRLCAYFFFLVFCSVSFVPIVVSRSVFLSNYYYFRSTTVGGPCRFSTSARNAKTHSFCRNSIAHFGSFDDSFRKRRTICLTVKAVHANVFSADRSSLSLSSDAYSVGFCSIKKQKVLKRARCTCNTIGKISRYASRFPFIIVFIYFLQIRVIRETMHNKYGSLKIQTTSLNLYNEKITYGADRGLDGYGGLDLYH